MKAKLNKRPVAIVLCQVLTGLATARGIAAEGVEVHAVTFTRREPVHFARGCVQIKLIGMENDETALIKWLIDYAKDIGNRPVVIPSSDKHALMLARYYEILAPHCRLSTVKFEDLWTIVSKDDLYKYAETAGLDVIPAIHEPSSRQLKAWSNQNPGPYFLKPFYEAVAGCVLGKKNSIFADRKNLLDYVDNQGAKSLIVQQLIRGGDGYIFDCYGLCDVSGKVLTLTSHRRWRQSPSNVGTTTYGEIPGHPEGMDESILFENTTRLLETMKYHGIFGIEWLQDRASGKLYLIDFNARPFSSIGHLRSCGINLPFLAYQELIGVDMSALSLRPPLKHKFWVDLLKDLQSLTENKGPHEFRLSEWIKSILRCRSFAYWDWGDPLPGLYRFWQFVFMVVRFLWKKIAPVR